MHEDEAGDKEELMVAEIKLLHSEQAVHLVLNWMRVRLILSATGKLEQCCRRIQLFIFCIIIYY